MTYLCRAIKAPIGTSMAIVEFRSAFQRDTTAQLAGTFTPIRACTPSSGRASCISAAARTARNASSSCATGTPNTASPHRR